jgi:hypothetical protein
LLERDHGGRAEYQGGSDSHSPGLCGMSREIILPANGTQSEPERRSVARRAAQERDNLIPNAS